MAERSAPVDTDDVVRIDLYAGAYGPTLRVDVQSGAALERLRSIFQALANGTAKEVVLEGAPQFQVSGLDRLRLVRRDAALTSDGKTLSRVEMAGGVEYFWMLDAEGWETRAELVNALLQGARAGHQYLTEEGVDDALVELAFLEGPRAR